MVFGRSAAVPWHCRQREACERHIGDDLAAKALPADVIVGFMIY